MQDDKLKRHSPQQTQSGKTSSAPGSSKQGGTHQQHVQAGSQSHKNAPGSSSAGRSGTQAGKSSGQPSRSTSNKK